MSYQSMLPAHARGGAGCFSRAARNTLGCVMQAYVGRARAESFSLTADMMYVSANAPRICRALFEICLRRSWSTAADMALTMCKVVCL